MLNVFQLITDDGILAASQPTGSHQKKVFKTWDIVSAIPTLFFASQSSVLPLVLYAV